MYGYGRSRAADNIGHNKSIVVYQLQFNEAKNHWAWSSNTYHVKVQDYRQVSEKLSYHAG